MAMLALKRLMSTQSERRRRRSQIRARGGSADRCSSSVAKRKKEIGRDGDVSPGAKRLRSAGLYLPEDIWRHIHSLMPLRDAARTACVSRAFSQSWRCHPNLTFNKSMLGSNSNGRVTDFIRTIDHVLKKHSGVNVKTLTLELDDFKNAWRRRMHSLLQIAMRPGIEEITLSFGFFVKATYKFPCWLLSDRIRNSIRCLKLHRCVFHPTVKLGPFRSLAMLRFFKVRITGYKLGCLLSNSLALEWLELNSCDELDCLKIPCQLQRLSYLRVCFCLRLYVIEIKAPNLLVFNLDAEKVKKLSFGVSVDLKQLYISSPDLASCARLEFLSNVPDLESLNLKSYCQVASSLMLPVGVKFLHLKEFNLSLTGQGVSEAYDYFSLASLLDSCPSLRNFFLNVSHKCVGHETMLEDPTHPRQMPGQQHGNLKSVTILGFCYAKSLVELTCYIVENTASLESLTLDIHGTRLVSASGILKPMYEGKYMEAPRTLLAIRTYIQGKIPSTVKLNVLEPCGSCSSVGR